MRTKKPTNETGKNKFTLNAPKKTTNEEADKNEFTLNAPKKKQPTNETDRMNLH